MNATKLICTLGRATFNRVPELVDAGMDVARINLSHSAESVTRSAFEPVRPGLVV